MLQERIVDIAYEGHLGIVKTKALFREKVGFACMDKIVETKIKACLPCRYHVKWLPQFTLGNHLIK